MAENPAAKMPESVRVLLHRGRAECPHCKRRGMGFAKHPHAFGYKDHTRSTCRFCHHSFKITLPVSLPEKLLPEPPCDSPSTPSS